MALPRYVGVDAVAIADGQPIATGALEVSFNGGAFGTATNGGGALFSRAYWRVELTPAERRNASVHVQHNSAAAIARTNEYYNIPSRTSGSQSALRTTFLYSTTITSGDPGSGYFRLNNAAPGSATALYMHVQSYEQHQVRELLRTFAINGLIELATLDGTAWARYSLTSLQTDNTDWVSLPVTYQAGAGTLTADAEIWFTFANLVWADQRAWDGDQSAVKLGPLNNLPQVELGPSQDYQNVSAPFTHGSADFYVPRYQFETAITPGAGNGGLRYNNATPAAVTAIYIDKQQLERPGMQNILAALGNGAKIELRGTAFNVFALYDITANADSGSYHTLTVTNTANAGTFANTEPLAVTLIAAPSAGGSWTPDQTIPASPATNTYDKMFRKAHDSLLTVVRGDVAATGSTASILAVTGLNVTYTDDNQFRYQWIRFDEDTTSAALRGSAFPIAETQTAANATNGLIDLVSGVTFPTIPVTGDTYTIS